MKFENLQHLYQHFQQYLNDTPNYGENHLESAAVSLLPEGLILIVALRSIILFLLGVTVNVILIEIVPLVLGFLNQNLQFELARLIVRMAVYSDVNWSNPLF